MNPSSVPLADRVFTSRFLALLFALCSPYVLHLRADGTVATLNIRKGGPDSEGGEIYRLEWPAVSNAIYRVQHSSALTPGAVWETVDTTTPAAGLGDYELKVRSNPGETAGFYRLILPQPEIFAVEPAIFPPDASVHAYVTGQCLETNDVLRLDGVALEGMIHLSNNLLHGPLPPLKVGAHVLELVRNGVVKSSYTVISADPRANPELVLQEPPESPPASPQPFLSKKGYDYYKALPDLAAAGARNNPYNMENNMGGDMPARLIAAFFSKKGYDYYQSQSAQNSTPLQNNPAFQNNNNQGTMLKTRLEAIAPGTGRDNDCDGLTRAQAEFFSTGDKVTICHRTTSVAPFSGEVQQRAVDLAIPGRGLDFVWARTYRSRQTQGASFGERWTHSYDVRCVRNSSGGMDVYDGTGRKDTYIPGPNEVFTCPGFFREGALSRNIFRLTFADTGYWEFNPFDGSPSGGKLALIVDRNGNTMILIYEKAGLLVQVVDDLGRTNNIGYDSAGRVTSVTDFSGRTVTYQYYDGKADEPGSFADLKSVTSPAVTGTPNGNDFPSGKTTTYGYSTGYSDDRENHLLLWSQDPYSETTQRFVYQHNQTDLEFLRCVSVQRGTNSPAMLSYLPQTPTPANQYAVLRCVINDPEGNVTEEFYDARNRCVNLREFTGRAARGVRVTDTSNRPRGKVRSSDPDYYETRWSWNNDSLCTSKIFPSGQQSRFVYQSDFDPSTPARKRADCRLLRQVACCGGADMDGDGIAETTERVWRFAYDPRFGSDLARAFGKKIYVGNLPFSATGKIVPTISAHAINTKGTGAAGRSIGIGEQCDTGVASATVDSAKIITDRDTGRSKGFGFIASVTDPRGIVTTARYDANGNRTRSIRQCHYAVSNLHIEVDGQYNAHGQLTAVTNAADANGYRRVDTLTYHSSGPQAGYLKSIAIDEQGVHLTTSFEYDARGNVTRAVDPRGNDYKFHNNALNQRVRVESPTNITARGVTDLFYDANDNLVQRTTEVRNETDVLVGSKVDRTSHDSLGRVTEIALGIDAGRALTNRFVYDGNDRCVLMLGADAVSGADPYQTLACQFDERGLLFRQVAAPGSAAQSSTQWDFDASGLVTRVTDGLESNPSITSFEYDGFAGSRYSMYGVMKGMSVSEAKPMAPRELAWVETVWNKQCVEKDTTVRLAKITDPMGNVTTFNYDANDNLKFVRHFGQTNDVPGTNGNICLAASRYEYDGLDRLVRSRDAFFNVSTRAPIGDGERTTTFAYAPNGDCTSVTDDLSRTTSYSYDTARRLSSVTDARGNARVIARDACGNPATVTAVDRSDVSQEAQMFVMNYTYDSLNRCVLSVDNVGNTERCAYDSLGNLVSCVTPLGDETFRVYDGLNRCIATTNFVSLSRGITLSTTHVEYDNSSRCIAIRDSNGNVTRYRYDSRNRVVVFGGADGTSRSFAWSPRSNLIREQDANGTIITNSYDLLDRCVRRDILPAPGVAVTTTFESFEYDGHSRLVHASNNVSCSSFTYNSLGYTEKATQDCLAAAERTFDSMGNCLSLTYRGGAVVSYSYNALNEVASVSQGMKGRPPVTLATFAYEGPGRIGRITRNNGVNTRVTWNGTANPPNASGDFGWQQVSGVNHQHAGGGAVIDRRGYSYDRNQNKTLRAQLTPFAPGGDMTTNIFGYDALNQLRLAIKTKGTSAQRTGYTLDGNGNRQTVAVTGNGATDVQTYLMDATLPEPADFQMNQYTLTPFGAQQYDHNGNLVARNSTDNQTQYLYDYADRLVSVQRLDASGVMEPLVSFTYDALGRRISKTVYPPAPLAPVTMQFIHGGDDDCDGILEEWVNGAFTRGYVLPEVGDEVLVSFTQNGELLYYHSDELGNVLALTDVGGKVRERYDYEDYGAVTFLTGDGSPTSATSSVVGNAYSWRGMRLDPESGLYATDAGAYFDPLTGSGLNSQGLPKVTPKIAKESHGRFRQSIGNNPWSGTGNGFDLKASDGKKHFEKAARWQAQNLKYGTGSDGHVPGYFGRVTKEEGGRHTPFHNKYRPQL